jgi:hypothetical protein
MMMSALLSLEEAFSIWQMRGIQPIIQGLRMTATRPTIRQAIHLIPTK